ncbi:hypothetical protein RhiJN_21817 [Ceratobasidium sp. AG-Ba]|nr:hypothetical protein RhiJN_21817 [Ceratobasidium sp. AG-Ba]
MVKRYIVMFKEGTPNEKIAQAAADVEKSGGTVTHRYWEGGGIEGFAATMEDDHLNSLTESSLQPGSAIDSIEPDGVVTTQ